MLDTHETVYHDELPGPWAGSLAVSISTDLSAGVWTISCATQDEGWQQISSGGEKRCKEAFAFHLESPEMIVLDIKGPKKRSAGRIHIRIRNSDRTTVYEDIWNV